MSKAKQLKQERSLVWQFSKYCNKSCENCLRMGYREPSKENLNLLQYIEKIKFLGISNLIIPCNSFEIVNLKTILRELKNNEIKITLILKDCYDFSDINFELISELDYLVLNYSKISIEEQMTILNLDQMFEPIFLFEDHSLSDLINNISLLPQPILQNRTLIQITNSNDRDQSWSVFLYRDIVNKCAGPISVLWPNSGDFYELLSSEIKIISKENACQPKLSVVFFTGKNFREFKDYIHHLSCQHVDKKKIELIIFDKYGLYINDKKSVEFILEESGFDYSFTFFNQVNTDLSEQENLAVFDLMLKLAKGEFLYPIEFNKFFNLKEFNRILKELDDTNGALVIKKGHLTKELELIFSSDLIKKKKNISNSNVWLSNINERMVLLNDAAKEGESKDFFLTTKINPTIRSLDKNSYLLRYLLFAYESDFRGYIRKTYFLRIFLRFFEIFFFVLLISKNSFRSIKKYDFEKVGLFFNKRLRKTVIRRGTRKSILKVKRVFAFNRD